MATKSPSLPPFIQAMLGTDFYPHYPGSVALRQTHISYVLMAGDYVYKVKKPVRFAFLDYSTLEKRRRFCHAEVRLNRKLAPTVYLNVVAIVHDGERFNLRESPATQEKIVEYAVKMRRLPEEYFLDRMIKEGRARREDFDRIAKKLADFYETAATDQASLYGSPELIRRNLEQNVKEIEPFTGETLTLQEFRDIRVYNANFLTGNGDLLQRRLRDRRVREGHGDLRAEHICLEEDPVIYDCIEFSEEFRYCDTASEIAFLSMDLDYLGAPMLSDHFVTSFQNFTKDPDLLRLLPLYKTYRACVRGKVEMLKANEPEVPEGEREEAKLRARRYFQLAHRYTRDPYPVGVIIVCGLAGSGKSTIARIVGARTGYQVLNSDTVRKQLAGVPISSHSAPDYGEGLYSESFNARTYDCLLKRAEECLQSGIGVIVDATFKNQQHRQQFLELSSRECLPVLFVECRASEETTLQRLKNRPQQPGEVSDATVGVYLRQRYEFAPLREIPDSKRMILSTEDDPEECAQQVLDCLGRIFDMRKPSPGLRQL
jgi:aminoglycoside phosphotransferase family enzyme/predicted kinase